ncbi:MAG: glycosyltransferase family 2 protein [Deltaproteobacteria bacterium]|nr:glycosyltransferase family 2 protein [Deltaproteobacteria bacterium]
MTPPLSVAILAYDEEENLPSVLAELFAYLDEVVPGAEVIVIDDGSSDDTARVAERCLEGRPGRVIRHPQNRGMGAGLKTAATAARSDWFTFLPADGQIPPEAVGTLLAARDDGPTADLVLSVYDHRDDGKLRKVLSWGVRTLIRAVHGVRMRSDGPYLIRRRLFDPEQLAPNTFFLNFELPIRAGAADLRTRTVTIPCRPRLAGVSKTARPGRALGVAKDLLAMRRRRIRETLDHW